LKVFSSQMVKAAIGKHEPEVSREEGPFCSSVWVWQKFSPREREWFARHILEIDMKYKRYFLERGVS